MCYKDTINKVLPHLLSSLYFILFEIWLKLLLNALTGINGQLKYTLSRVIFIYIALLTIQIVSKHLTALNRKIVCQ